jgi:hypothetical protein
VRVLLPQSPRANLRLRLNPNESKSHGTCAAPHPCYNMEIRQVRDGLGRRHPNRPTAVERGGVPVAKEGAVNKTCLPFEDLVFTLRGVRRNLGKCPSAAKGCNGRFLQSRCSAAEPNCMHACHLRHFEHCWSIRCSTTRTKLVHLCH